MFNIILDQFSVAENQSKYIFPDVIVDISSAHVMPCEAGIAEWTISLEPVLSWTGNDSGKA